MDFDTQAELEQFQRRIHNIVNAKDQRIAELEKLLPNNKKQITYEREIAELKARLKDLETRHTGNVRLLTRQHKAVDAALGITADERHAMSDGTMEGYAGGYGAFKLLLDKYNEIKYSKSNKEK